MILQISTEVSDSTGESKLRTESPQGSAKVRFQVAEADKSDQVLNEPHPLTSRKITAQRDR